MEYNTTLAICDSTMGNVIHSMLTEFPTIKEAIRCTSNCQTKFNTLVYLTYQTENGHVQNLQQYIDNRQHIKKSKCTQDVSGNICDGVKEIISEFSDMHLFIDVLHWEGENVISKDRSSEAAAQVKEKLCDIPQILQHNSKTYELRGVLSFKAGKTKLRNSIGHYCAFAKRGTSNWEQFDDMKIKTIPVKDTKVVNCEFLVYSI
ncbi:uncharacterized protein LOC126553771 [Aphis gossypii]|uniref:uncharacterized protein LOC126553771 n=1 Tax=Aphis gossypii TaxID=80765 RepID=UPI0021599252|nr:uncharacterized protein LOC126553771 [Aphis gossypii]